jgi:hypothetical protein
MKEQMNTTMKDLLFDLEFYLKDYERQKQQAKDRDDFSSAAYYCGIITGLTKAKRLCEQYDSLYNTEDINEQT